eukprot:6417-Heterococcus_DN1.PRE.2
MISTSYVVSLVTKAAVSARCTAHCHDNTKNNKTLHIHNAAIALSPPVTLYAAVLLAAVL